MKQVFIIHGWTYNLEKWEPLIQNLKERGIEPILLKVPGLTASSNQVWDINGYIDWLSEQLADIQNPVVIGHSNGGRIALAFINVYPDKIGRLILIDSAGIAHNQLRSVTKLKTLKYLAKVGKPFSKIPGVRKVVYKTIGARDYYEASPNMRLTMRNMLAADQRIDFNKIKLPVTIIWGRQDTITPISDGEAMQRQISGSKLQVINDARHAPFFNHPQEVADLIEKAIQD
ncbi:MAG TPA: alpha/beta hydrolase [Candidatus Saccharimonadales bacterium]|nr:alpha/beta hydrolase [Candidatus Saccharimonadales bacterium]